jgi:hypothetical protein
MEFKYISFQAFSENELETKLNHLETVAANLYEIANILYIENSYKILIKVKLKDAGFSEEEITRKLV